MRPDSVLVRAVLWLLFHGQVFAPDRDLVTESAYMRMRGAKKWPWTVDASFRFIHDTTHDDIRGNFEPCSKFLASFFPLPMLPGSFLCWYSLPIACASLRWGHSGAGGVAVAGGALGAQGVLPHGCDEQSCSDLSMHTPRNVPDGL